MKYRTLIKFIFCFLAISAFQQSFAKNEDIFDLTLEENLRTPQIKKNNLVEIIQEYQHNQAVELLNSNYDVELTRNNEVIIITITADKLFSANDTTLKGEGKVILRPITQFLRNPEFYKIVLVMHTDNTGSAKYAIDFTRARVNAVFDWFEANGNVNYVVPYALGSKEPSPLTGNNNSILNRQLNRRLEIYLIPNDGMINQAKHGSININIPAKK